MKSRRSGKAVLVPISTLLQQTQKKTQSAFTISRLRKVWPEVVGELLARQTKPKKADRGILWVSVDNSGLNYELSLMKPLMIEKIFETSKQSYKDIKFIHEQVVAPGVAGEQVSKQKFIRMPAKEDETLDSILKNLKTLSKDLQKTRKD